MPHEPGHLRGFEEEDDNAAPTRIIKVGPDGKKHYYGWNPKTQDFDRDFGLVPESAPSISVSAGSAGPTGSVSEKELRAAGYKEKRPGYWVSPKGERDGAYQRRRAPNGDFFFDDVTPAPSSAKEKESPTEAAARRLGGGVPLVGSPEEVAGRGGGAGTADGGETYLTARGRGTQQEVRNVAGLPGAGRGELGGIGVLAHSREEEDRLAANEAAARRGDPKGLPYPETSLGTTGRGGVPGGIAGYLMARDPNFQAGGGSLYERYTPTSGRQRWAQTSLGRPRTFTLAELALQERERPEDEEEFAQGGQAMVDPFRMAGAGGAGGGNTMVLPETIAGVGVNSGQTYFTAAEDKPEMLTFTPMAGNRDQPRPRGGGYIGPPVRDPVTPPTDPFAVAQQGPGQGGGTTGNPWSDWWNSRLGQTLNQWQGGPASAPLFGGQPPRPYQGGGSVATGWNPTPEERFLEREGEMETEFDAEGRPIGRRSTRGGTAERKLGDPTGELVHGQQTVTESGTIMRWNALAKAWEPLPQPTGPIPSQGFIPGMRHGGRVYVDPFRVARA